MIEFPLEIEPAENETILTQPSFSFKSAFTGVQQNVTHPGARWSISMSFPPFFGYKGRLMRAFCNSLQGSVQPVKVYDHSREGRPPMGAPAVSGDGQMGRSLLTNGWIPNQKVLEIGDLFTVNDELKEVSEDCWSDINGTATVKFNPPLRKSPPNSAPLETERPYMIGTLDGEGVSVRTPPGGLIYIGDVTFLEAIYK